MLKRADLHLHTRFSEWKHLRIIKPSDSYNEPFDVYRRCKEIGMDFVAITDHDTINGALDLLAKHPELEPEIIVGEEVETWFPDTGQWVHVNVFDIDEATHRDLQRLSRNIYELVAYLRARGLFHVLNHPFQSYRLQRSALGYVSEILALFDHFEVGNGTLSSRHNKAVAEMLEYAAALYTLKHGVGGSDAHNLRHIGFYWTEAEVPDGAPGAGGKQDWLAALARGEGRAVGRTLGAAGLMANVYRTIGQYYLSLRDPEVRKHMRARNYLAAAILAPGCLLGVPAFISLGNSLRVELVCRHLRRALRQADRAVEGEPIAPPSPELLEDPQD
jgi:predicted metal-dependent phosphoesterase TrpH